MSLNERQKAFCEHYVACLNATEAARKAGYSEKTAYSIGQRLLKNVEIKKYLQTLTERAKTGRIADATEVLEYLTETMRSEVTSRRERTKAAELLGKRYALFVERADMSISGEMGIELDGLTTKELKNLANLDDGSEESHSP